MPNASFTDKLKDRLPKIKAFANGQITDIDLPREAQPSDMTKVRQAGFFAHLWTTPHGLTGVAYASQVLGDYDRLRPGAVELNVEVPDNQLEDYMRGVHAAIRAVRPYLRLRFNIAPFKAAFLPVDLLQQDPNLYVIEQAYFGNMDGRAAENEILRDMDEAGVPQEKSSVMYGAHVSSALGKPRVPALPALTIRALKRGSVYQDDLMVDAGYL
jgi:hypothetical protein